MRRGFTLAELVVVLAILSIAAAASAPAIGSLIGGETASTAEAVARLLRNARAAALKEARATTVMLNPANGRYTVAIAGTETVHGLLTLTEGSAFEGSAARIRFHFAVTGPAIGEPVIVREGGRTVVITADRWTGEVRVRAP